MTERLRQALNELADESAPRQGAERAVVEAAKKRRRLSAALAAMSLVVLIAGVAAAASLVTDVRRGQDPVVPAGPTPTEDPDGQAPDPEGAERVVAEGEVPEDASGELAGVQWQVLADADASTWCWAFREGANDGDPMTTCTPRDTDISTDPLQGLVYSKEREQDDTLLHGGVSSEVERVELRLDSGATIEARMVDAPTEMDIPSRYFVAYVPDLGPGRVFAYDADGGVLQEAAISENDRGPGESEAAEADSDYEPPSASEEEERYIDEDDDVSVIVPEGWKVAEENLTPTLDNPREILSLGTSPLIPGGRCAQQPVKTFAGMKPEDAFITVQERDGEALHEKRPLSLRKALEDRSFDYEACTDLGDFRVFWFPFDDQDRDFHLLAVLGNRATRATTDDFWHALESLDFAPTAGSDEQ